MPRGQFDRSAARARRGEISEAVPEASGADACEAVRLLAPHGYVEERFHRGVFQWNAGEIITNPDEIAHLRARGARMEPA